MCIWSQRCVHFLIYRYAPRWIFFNVDLLLCKKCHCLHTWVTFCSFTPIKRHFLKNMTPNFENLTSKINVLIFLLLIFWKIGHLMMRHYSAAMGHWRHHSTPEPSIQYIAPPCDTNGTKPFIVQYNIFRYVTLTSVAVQYVLHYATFARKSVHGDIINFFPQNILQLIHHGYLHIM
jgi:hypothetical protein